MPTETSASCREEARCLRTQAGAEASLALTAQLEEIAGSYDVLARFLELVDQPDTSSLAAGQPDAAPAEGEKMR